MVHGHALRSIFQLWSSMLRKVILHCYKYHDCEYLLDFSGQLMHRRAQSIDSIVIVDNGNGTRSLKNITNNNLLVTFKSENQVSFWFNSFAQNCLCPSSGYW